MPEDIQHLICRKHGISSHYRVTSIEYSGEIGGKDRWLCILCGKVFSERRKAAIPKLTHQPKVVYPTFMSTDLSPIESEFPSVEAAQSYDDWFKAKVEKALADTRPQSSHDQVMGRMRALIENRKKATSNSNS